MSEKHLPEQPELDEALLSLYGAERLAREKERYRRVAERFRALYGESSSLSFFSAPGRTEIGGNHTDHQRGRVLAAAVDLDVIAAVRKTDDGLIRVKSEGHRENVVTLSSLDPRSEEKGKSTALVRGIAARFAELGFSVGGFAAVTSSDVLSGSGLSSSAAFEVLIGTILNGLYNGGSIDPLVVAQIGQYAENRYFGKPCGLMDQAASASGGLVLLDFADKERPRLERIDYDFSTRGYALCVVNTGGSHADLTDEYAAIPAEMRSVAERFGGEVLRDVAEKEVLEDLAALRNTPGGDRAVLRALHFFEENARVAEMAAALKEDRLSDFLALVEASGRSSFCRLQNVVSTASAKEQGIALGLALTERFLGGSGVCRVHGGGFAGTMQVYLPLSRVEAYRAFVEGVFGAGCCRVLKVRPRGGIRVV